MSRPLVFERRRRQVSGVRHAEHFLTRLDRLPRCEVDLALDLYRDADLLHHVLVAAERVAISLDDPETGPFPTTIARPSPPDTRFPLANREKRLTEARFRVTNREERLLDASFRVTG